MCSKSEAYPEDCYAGVSPDYYVSMNWEDVLEVNEMFPDNESGEHSTYENKQKWDDCLIKALELIDENNG